MFYGKNIMQMGGSLTGTVEFPFTSSVNGMEYLDRNIKIISIINFDCFF